MFPAFITVDDCVVKLDMANLFLPPRILWENGVHTLGICYILIMQRVHVLKIRNFLCAVEILFVRSTIFAIVYGLFDCFTFDIWIVLRNTWWIPKTSLRHVRLHMYHIANKSIKISKTYRSKLRVPKENYKKIESWVFYERYFLSLKETLTTRRNGQKCSACVGSKHRAGEREKFEWCQKY